MKNNHPEIDIPKLCLEAGLPYEYLIDENNWVSIVFDLKFIELCIKKTNQNLFCYKVGAQSLSEETIGKPLFYLSKYLVSLKFIYEQVSKFTELFSKITQIAVIESRKNFIRLRFRALDSTLDESEKEALRKNFRNIFENTIGHYASIPSCQGMPLAQIDYEELWDNTVFPQYDIKISYTSSRVLLLNTALISTPFISVGLGFAFHFNFGFESLLSTLSAIVIFSNIILLLLVLKYSKLSVNFHLVMKTLSQLDQRYLTLQNLKEDLTKLSTSYSRFVPKEFLKLLDRTSITDVELGDHIEAEMTVMFTDIRDFTKLSEQLSPKENFQFLNSYLARISPFIREHHGFIDKYIGDGTMAIFPDSPEEAILAAIDITHHLERYNEDRRQVGYQPIKLVIAIHTGRLILGTIGYRAQMQGTVISDAVNTASRLEAVAKRFDLSIVASEQTFTASGLVESIGHRYLGKLPITGRKELVSVYEIFHTEPSDRLTLLVKTKPQFEEAVSLFNDAKYPEAALLFNQVVLWNPQDKVALYYLELSRRESDSAKSYKSAG